MLQFDPANDYCNYLDTLSEGELRVQLEMVQAASNKLTANSRTGAKESAIEIGNDIHRRIAAFQDLQKEPSVMPIDTYGVEEHLQRFPY